MSNGPLLFLGVLITLASSFWGLILAPQLQFGRQQPRLIEATGEYYPPQRPGLATRGADVYRSLGCVECHSQQVRQTGVTFDVWVTELTTNVAAVAPKIVAARPGSVEADVVKALASLPTKVAGSMTVSAAQTLAKQLTESGAKSEAVLMPQGSDIERRWGRRMSVAQDYLRDYPVQLGSLRLGPDLANYGARAGAVSSLILQHLYEPASTMPGSIMPPYRFLFARRPFALGEALPVEAVVLKKATADLPGDVLIPNEDALALLAYLQSLKAETSLYEAPVGNPPAPAAAPGSATPTPAP